MIGWICARCWRVFRDLHLCCVCSLWIHSHISPHPQHQFSNEAVCIDSEGRGKEGVNIAHSFSAVGKAALLWSMTLTCSSSSDNPDTCKGGNFSPRWRTFSSSLSCVSLSKSSQALVRRSIWLDETDASQNCTQKVPKYCYIVKLHHYIPKRCQVVRKVRLSFIVFLNKKYCTHILHRKCCPNALST